MRRLVRVQEAVYRRHAVRAVADLEKNGVRVGTRLMIEIYSTLTLGYIQNVGILRSEISNVIIKHKKTFT